MNIIGVDIGGTNTRTSLINNAKILFTERFKTFEFKKSDEFISRLFKSIEEALSKTTEKISAIIIAVPGTIENNRVAYAPNLGWFDVPLSEKVENRFNIPVLLENDGNMATIGEFYYGSLKETVNSILLTIGTGVGGGIIINKELYRGKSGGAPEIGHFIINMGGRKCGCGLQGCFEAYASASGLIRTAKEKYLLHGDNSFPDSLLEQKMMPERLFESYKKKDGLSVEIISEYVDHLLTGIGSLINIFEPDKIALGGGVMLSHKIILPLLHEKIEQYTFPGFRKKCEICSAMFLDGSAHFGAYALAEKWIGKD